MLGGEVVNYYQMYENPMRMHTGGREAGGVYYSVASDDPGHSV